MSDHHDSSSPSSGDPGSGDYGNGEHGGGAVADAATLHVDQYEGAWMRLSFVVLAIFFVAIVFSSFTVGFQVPGVYQRIDPATLMNADSPFANPTLRELAPGKYEVHIRAQVWSFTPGEIHVPVGSSVTFYVTSLDVQHGVKIAGTNINMMILPGQVSTLRTTFNTPGTFNFVCHEYCGIMHHTMYGRIIVEPESAPDSEASAATYLSASVQSGQPARSN
jgi:cytochrome c oxidase subunit 2